MEKPYLIEKISFPKESQALIDLFEEFRGFLYSEIYPFLFPEKFKNKFRLGKLAMLVIYNKNSELNFLAIKLLCEFGLAEQAFSITRTQYETWLDSEYVRLSKDPKIVEKSEKYLEITRLINLEQIKRYNKKWFNFYQKVFIKSLKNRGETISAAITEAVNYYNFLYPRKTKAKNLTDMKIPLHWSDQKDRLSLIKARSKSTFNKLEAGRLSIYRIGSEAIHGNISPELPKYPSSEDDIRTSLFGGLLCFILQSDCLQKFRKLGLSEKIANFVRKINPVISING